MLMLPPICNTATTVRRSTAWCSVLSRLVTQLDASASSIVSARDCPPLVPVAGLNELSPFLTGSCPVNQPKAAHPGIENDSTQSPNGSGGLPVLHCSMRLPSLA